MWTYFEISCLSETKNPSYIDHAIPQYCNDGMVRFKLGGRKMRLQYRFIFRNSWDCRSGSSTTRALPTQELILLKTVFIPLIE